MKTKFIIGFTAGIFAVGAMLIEKRHGVYSEAHDISGGQLAASVTSCGAVKFQLTGVDTTRQIAPLFNNLGDHHFAVTTDKEEAQGYFDQGLRLCYAFNHAEAHRSFMEATRLDPDMAMGYWGMAFALGPNINDPLPDDARKSEAFKATQKAEALSARATEKERDLIAALLTRHHNNTDKSIDSLNRIFMEAMEKVADKYPQDTDVLALYADAVMNTMPWDYWEKDGTPHANTLKAKEALESAIKLNPKNPGAHHSYIHLVELPHPELGVPSAEILGSLMPGAGHLVHMPSHIFIRVGRYADAVRVNQQAVLADEDYISQCYSQGIYPLAYYPHNLHFLWSAATLTGDSKTAIDAAKKTAEKIPLSELVNFPFLQDYASTPMLAYTRFGKWNEVLTIPYPGKHVKHLSLIWHYARGIAFVRRENFKEAAEELKAIAGLKQDPELENLVANYTNPSSKIARVAYEVLAGEMEAAKGDFNKAVIHLEKGVQYEDELTYSEPAPWHIPVRQSMGNILLKAERPAEAEAVFRKDLANVRQNGWSLMGLAMSLQAQDKNREARQVKQEFNRMWGAADIDIVAAVY